MSSYFCLKGSKDGIYGTLDELRLQMGIIKEFDTYKEAKRYMDFKENNKKKKRTPEEMLKEYRNLTDDKNRIKYISNLNDYNKNDLYKLMDIGEINHYKKIASNLMEKRFTSVSRNRALLDLLLVAPYNVSSKTLMNGYGELDLSITIYSMKSIINVMGESNFSKDDGSAYNNINSAKYYRICKDYWDRIWWDTDTGKLSKEQIERREFTEYHTRCNKIETIVMIKKYIEQYALGYSNKRYKITDFKDRDAHV